MVTPRGANGPVGATLQVKLTALVKPLVGAMVIVEVALPPAETEARERAVAAIVKSAGGITVRPTVVS